MLDLPRKNRQQLRELAAWYRNYAERAHAPWVHEGRLQTAKEIERAAAMLEEGPLSAPVPGSPFRSDDAAVLPLRLQSMSRYTANSDAELDQ